MKMDLQGVDVEAWTISIWLKIGTGRASCECGNEPSGSIKCGEFLHWEPAGFSRSTVLHGVST